MAKDKLFKLVSVVTNQNGFVSVYWIKGKWIFFNNTEVKEQRTSEIKEPILLFYEQDLSNSY